MTKKHFLSHNVFMNSLIDSIFSGSTVKYHCLMLPYTDFGGEIFHDGQLIGGFSALYCS